MSRLTEWYSQEYNVRYTESRQELINELESMNQTLNTQANFIEATKLCAYIVGSVTPEGSLGFSQKPVIHIGAQAARTECARLAAITPGKLFIFVKLSGGQLNPVTSAISF